MALGTATLASDEGVERLMDTLHKNLAPDAHDSAFRDVVSFFGLRRTHQTPDEYLSLFTRALRRVEARLPDGAMFPEMVVSSMCLQNAGLSSHQKSMVLTSTGGDPSLENTKKQMRRILQPCGTDLKQDAMAVNNDDLNVVPGLGEAKLVSKKKNKNKKGL